MSTPEAPPTLEPTLGRSRWRRLLRAIPWRPILIAALFALALLALGFVCSPAYWR